MTTPRAEVGGSSRDAGSVLPPAAFTLSDTVEAIPAGPPALRTVMVRSLPLLAAVGLLMMGTGLGGSVIGIRADREGFDTAVTGLIMSGYYGGFLVGSLAMPALIARVGHIRVFAGMASIASAALLLPAVALAPLAWWVLRLLAGLCVAGLFVVSETWLNGAATNRSRGQLLAAYMVVVTGGLAVGQLLLNVASPLGFGAFILASVLVSAAVVPVALVSVAVPDAPDPRPLSVRALAAAAPLGLVGAAASGFAAATVVGFGAVYASRVGLSVAQTSVLLFAALVGAIALQFGIGAVADRVDRRVLILGGTSVAALAALVATTASGTFWLLILLTAVAGGMAFPLYSLANAHLNDHLHEGTVLAAGARMVLLNGAGAVAGPLTAAVVMDVVGSDGFFFVLVAAYAATAGFATWRMVRRPPVAPEDRSTYVAMPSGTGPTVMSLTPDAADELYPETEGDVDRDGLRIHWRERGAGPPVVLLHDAGSSSRSWSETLLGLADAGHRAIAYDLRGHGHSDRAPGYDLAAQLGDLDAVLAAREVPVASVVGLGAGGALALEHARRDPARVLGLVLVSTHQLLAPRRGRTVRGGIDRLVGSARAVLPATAAASLEARETYARRRAPERYRRLATDLRLAARPAVARTRALARATAVSGAADNVSVPVLRVEGERLRGVVEHPSVLVDDAAYYVPLDQPSAFVDAVTPFLREVADAAMAAAGLTASD